MKSFPFLVSGEVLESLYIRDDDLDDGSGKGCVSFINLDNMANMKVLIEATKEKVENQIKAFRLALIKKLLQTDANPDVMCLPVVICIPYDMNLKVADAKRLISPHLKPNGVDFVKIEIGNEKNGKTKFNFPEDTTTTAVNDLTTSSTPLTSHPQGSTEFHILFKKCEFERDSCDQQYAKHHYRLASSDIEIFLNDYFATRQETLITIPDFDRIKVTKLFELGVPKKGELSEKDPVDDYPVDPWDSTVFSYIGEVEKFWPQFGLWEKDPKGLLMHGYSQNELKPLLINDQFFSFEFDWLYFSSQSVTLVEVTICEDPGKKENIESRVKEKVKQILKHICTLKLIVWYILKHFNPESQLLCTTEFNNFLGRCFKFVIHLANVEIEANVKNLSKQLLNLMQMANFKGENVLLAGSTSKLYKLDFTNEILHESSLTSSCEVSDEDIELLKWISATFALGYFVQKGSTILDNHLQCPGPFAERYIERQRTFLRKFTHFSNADTSFLKELNVILSPQQFGVLFANPKVVFLTGESGAGKTELLLAKALQSASDNSIDKIFFCMPSQYVSSGGKPQLRKLWNYVEGFREKHKRRFNDKFEIISYETLISRSFLQKAPVWWNRTVLLIDEFHYRYDSTFGISSEEFKNACLKIGPYLKNFWFATITLKWYDGMRKIIDTFVPLEFLSTKPLNVQYRSATHIGQFCTNLVHVDRDGRFSGTKVPGVFISKSQDKVTLKKFKKDNQESKDQTFFDSTNPGRDLSPNYEGNRWVVCCCEKRNKETWVASLEKYIERQRKFVAKFPSGSEAEANTNSEKELIVIQPEDFVFAFEEGPSGVHLSGAEVHSVILFIDGPLEEMYRSSPEEKDKIDNIFLLVCARAQFELVVYVREDLAHLWGTFQKCMKADMERKKKFSNEAITQPPESSSSRDDDGPNKEETARSENSGNVSPQLPGNEAPNNEAMLENENLTQGTQG